MVKLLPKHLANHKALGTSVMAFLANFHQKRKRKPINPTFYITNRRTALKLGANGLMGAFGFGLAACSSFPASDDKTLAPSSPISSQPLPPPEGAAKAGAVKIGVILSLTQNGAVNPAGVALSNAIALAIGDNSDNAVALLVEDDLSTPDGATAAAQKLLGQGAEIILGPLYAQNVSAVAAVVKPTGRPVIAFSTDPEVASRGVYLLSFLIDNYIDGVVGYAARKGKKNFAALLPDNDYGRLSESVFQAAVSSRNLSLVAIEKYRPDQIDATVSQLASLPERFDALYVGEQVSGLNAVMQALNGQKRILSKVQILGPGLWSDPQVFKNPLLQGAWYAGADPAGFMTFAHTYRQKYGQDPLRIASLGFDAGSLAAALAKMPPPRFQEGILTNRAGFNGTDGLFRFKKNGTNDRGMAIFEVRNNGAAIIQPAPTKFDENAG